ncbi:putative protein P2 [Fragaria vesca associated virus 1]|nr:putative protein P2 [Fragaria vesca associated virus 1]
MILRFICIILLSIATTVFTRPTVSYSSVISSQYLKSINLTMYNILFRSHYTCNTVRTDRKYAPFIQTSQCVYATQSSSLITPEKVLHDSCGVTTTITLPSSMATVKDVLIGTGVCNGNSIKNCVPMLTAHTLGINGGDFVYRVNNITVNFSLATQVVKQIVIFIDQRMSDHQYYFTSQYCLQYYTYANGDNIVLGKSIMYKELNNQFCLTEVSTQCTLSGPFNHLHDLIDVLPMDIQILASGLDPQYSLYDTTYHDLIGDIIQLNTTKAIVIQRNNISYVSTRDFITIDACYPIKKIPLTSLLNIDHYMHEFHNYILSNAESLQQYIVNMCIKIVNLTINQLKEALQKSFDQTIKLMTDAIPKLQEILTPFIRMLFKFTVSVILLLWNEFLKPTLSETFNSTLVAYICNKTLELIFTTYIVNIIIVLIVMMLQDHNYTRIVCIIIILIIIEEFVKYIE